MPVPKRSTTHSKKKMRSANKHLRPEKYAVCPNCQAPKLPHRVCMECGYYGDKQVFEIMEE